MIKTVEERRLYYGDKDQAYDLEFLKTLDLVKPENPEQFQKLETRMEEIFQLSEIKDKWIPVQLLRVCEALGIKTLSLTPGVGLKINSPFA